MSESNHITAAIHHFKVYSGDSFICTITLTDDNDVALDLTDAIVRFQVKKTPLTPALFLITNVVATNGLHGMELSGDTFNVLNINKICPLPGGLYKYDIQVTYPDGVVVTYLRGDFLVTDDITD